MSGHEVEEGPEGVVPRPPLTPATSRPAGAPWLRAGTGRTTPPGRGPRPGGVADLLRPAGAENLAERPPRVVAVGRRRRRGDWRPGQTHVQKYTKPPLEKVLKGEIDPPFVVTHRLPLDQGPAAYRVFRDKQDNCIKVVLKP